MWRTYFGFVLLGATLLVTSFTTNARADLLFSDNFDGAVPTATNDFGLNDNLNTRESGNNAGAGWVLGSTYNNAARPSQFRVNDPSYVSNALAIWPRVNNMISANINHNFTDAEIAQDGGFTVRFDCAPIYTSTHSFMYRYYTGVGVGGSQYSESLIWTNRYGDKWKTFDRSIHVTPASSFYAYKPPQMLGSGKFDTSQPATTTGPFKGPIYTFELRVATTSFAPGQSATGRVYWGPQGTPTSALTQVNLNVGTPAANYMTWTWDTDNTNYISWTFFCVTGTWYQNSQLTVYNMIDNVSVWSGMGTPEPSTLILVGTGVLGLLAYAWRRRRK